MITWVAAAVLVVGGYILGRARPWLKLRERAWWWVMFPQPGRLVKPKILAGMALWADRFAPTLWRHWRARNDPPPEPVQIRVRPEFLHRPAAPPTTEGASDGQ